MSLLSMLVQTYDANAGVVGKNKDQAILEPIAHLAKKAQIEVTIDENGKFRRAEMRDKNAEPILMPVTEESGGRSGTKIAPHPLFDELGYIAKGFSEHISDEKKKKQYEKKYEAYITALKQWADSEYSTPKVQAVYQYLESGTLLEDIREIEKLEWNTDDDFLNKKVGGSPYDKLVVVFRVHIFGDSSDDAVWTDKELRKKYTQYYFSKMTGERDICYLTGEKSIISENHPKNIVATDSNAKLISANDDTNFTYLGRFQDDKQAVRVGFEVSQKAHSALKWLVKKQGVTLVLDGNTKVVETEESGRNFVGKEKRRTYVCWCPSGKEVLNPTKPLRFKSHTIQDLTRKKYKNQIYRLLNGYKHDYFNAQDKIVLAMLDAATPGRMAVTYYSEFSAWDFFDRMENWYQTCCWDFGRIVMTPSHEKIIECAYGTETKDKNSGNKTLSVKDGVLKKQFQTLMHCMLYNQPIPKDIEQLLVDNASNPQKYDKDENVYQYSKIYETVLSTACAVIAKNYHLNEGEDSMNLEQYNNDRSFWFGSLLAVLEKAEKVTYDKENDSKRVPNATRFQAMFVKHPMSTYKRLCQRVLPYLNKLESGSENYYMSRDYYEKKIDEIFSKIEQFPRNELDKPLGATYLIGYSHQRKEMRAPAETDVDDNTNKEE